MSSYTIGIDLGGTNLRIAAYASKIPPATEPPFLSRIDLLTRVEAGAASVVAEMASAIQALDARLPNHLLAGIGLGTPGPLELPAGILRGPPNLPGWDNFPLLDALKSALAGVGVNVPVSIESDANLAALAELTLGAGQVHGVDSLAMFTLGTGVGNALILNGAIWSGVHGMAGEAGHLTIWPDGPQCNCGNVGCLELYASATGIRRMAEQAASPGSAPGLAAWRDSGRPLTAQAVAELARHGDADAMHIFSTVGAALGIGLAALVNTLDLQLYVIGGGVAAAWDLFAPVMLRELKARSYVYRLANQRIPGRAIAVVPAQLGSDSGLLGAALLPLDPALR